MPSAGYWHALFDSSQAMPYPGAMATDQQGQAHMTIDQAVTADDLLTALYSVPAGMRTTALQGRSGAAWLRMLQGAADLCGVDAAGMTRRQAIDAVVGNF